MTRHELSGDAVYDLSSNENPFGPSPAAVEAIGSQLAALNAYPQRTDSQTRRLLAAHHGERYAGALTADHFVTANGAVELIDLIQQTLFARHDSNSVVICSPAFSAYAGLARKHEATVIDVALVRPRFDIDHDRLIDAIRDDTRIVYLCNPNNPTGSVFGDDVLVQLLDRLPPHVLVVYDEVYFHYATEVALPDGIGHVLEARNMVVLHSFSKVFGLAGLRAGYAVGSPHLIDSIAARKRPFHVGALAMSAIEAALDDRLHVRSSVRNNTEQRRSLYAQLKGLGLQVWPSQANFLLFACPTGLAAVSLIEQLRAYGVIVREAFDLPDHIRVTVSTPEGNQRFVEAMAEILARRE